MTTDRPGFSRREFLRQTTAAAVGTVALEAAASDEARSTPFIQQYKTLGKTGLKMSDIGMGSGPLENPALVRHAFSRGVRYFDTAESYPMKRPGLAEDALGIALKPHRNDVVIASKAKATPNRKPSDFTKRLEASLRRLRTDRIDIYFNHAVNDPETLQNDEWNEFIALAKLQGKIRFTGMSGHGGRLAESVDYALDHDLVDVVLLAHNFGQDPAFYEKFTKSFDFIAIQPQLPRLFEKAHAKGVGTIAMKTLRGARLNDMRPYEWGNATFAQAAIRWVLANPSVDGLIVSMRTTDEIDEYVRASGQAKVRASDTRLLRHYLAVNDATYCRHGCNACESSCPAGVAVSEVLRTRMYATDYEDLELACASYAALGEGASPCLTCANPTCASACPFGLDVPTLTRSTPDILSA